LSVEERASALVAELTVEEKVGQLVRDAPRIDRLNLPAYHWRNNVLHGVVDNGESTVFPVAIGLGATFDEDLLQDAARVWAEEQRAKFNLNRSKKGDSVMNYGLDLWGPVVNLCIHPLWGRCQETYGEDPLLTSRLALRVVRALQEEKNGVLKTISTLKHFIAYGVDDDPPRLEIYENLTLPDLRQYYLPAWKTTIVQGGARSIMCSYNGVNITLQSEVIATPMCESPLLEIILRDELGFSGYVTTDTGALEFLVTKFKKYASEKDAAAAALKAGVDLNSGTVFSKLFDAFKDGSVTEKLIDRAVTRLMRARVQMGTLNLPNDDPFRGIAEKQIDSMKHQAVARRAVEESIVLLKNRNNILPLKESRAAIAVIGPAANDTMRFVGNYYGCSFDKHTEILPACGFKTVLQAIREIHKEGQVHFAEGTKQATESRSDFDKAVEIAKKADVAILVVGLETCNSKLTKDRKSCEGEGKDRSFLGLPGNQGDLIKSIHGIGIPVVVVLMSGSPVDISWEAEHVDAVLVVWYGGAKGGIGVADVLFGRVSPSGKLPVTFLLPSQLPENLHGMNLQDKPGRTHRYLKETPLYAFGFGLSYQTISLDNLSVRTRLVNVEEERMMEIPFRACADITWDNTTRIEVSNGTESTFVILAFASLKGSGEVLSKPLKQLVGFARVPLSAKSACAKIDFESMKLVDKNGDFRVVEGTYDFFLGLRAPGAMGRFVDPHELPEPLHKQLQIKAERVISAQ